MNFLNKKVYASQAYLCLLYLCLTMSSYAYLDLPGHTWAYLGLPGPV